MAYTSFVQLVDDAAKHATLADAIASHEAEVADTSPEAIRLRMREMLDAMRSTIDDAHCSDARSRTGLIGGDAKKLHDALRDDCVPIVVDPLFIDVLTGALATAEVNARMGRIVAAPTAGASGVLPGVVLAVADRHDLSDEQLVDGLLVAGAIGEIFAASSTLSGAAGGCQAEIGTAAAMTAGALCSLLGGSIEQVGHAATLAIQGLLGLVCDPVGGLVEIPCVMRNATGASVALAAAQMALAGIEFPIPLDEVVSASSRVGALIDPTLRETAQAGLATTPTARKLAEELEK